MNTFASKVFLRKSVTGLVLVVEAKTASEDGEKARVEIDLTPQEAYSLAKALEQAGRRWCE